MKLEVYNPVKDKVSPTVRLVLRESDHIVGDVELHAVNEYGVKVDRGHILTINKSGTLSLCAGVTNELGLKLDMRYRIVVEESL